MGYCNDFKKMLFKYAHNLWCPDRTVATFDGATQIFVELFGYVCISD